MKAKVIGILIIAGLLGVIAFFSVVVYISASFFNPQNEIHNEVQVYSVNEFNPLTNTTQRSFARMPRSLSFKEYISYFGDSGNFIVISRLSDDEYECVGDCFCYDDEDEDSSLRRTASIVTNALYFLVFAASSLLAVQIAKDYFQKECERQYSSNCMSVGSKIRWCLQKSAEKVADLYLSYKAKGDGESKLFSCTGSCIDLTITADKVFNTKLGKMIPDIITSYYKGDLFPSTKQIVKCNEHTITEEIQGVTNMEARTKFFTQKLIPFCRQVGTLEDGIEVCHSFIHNIECLLVADV